MKEPFEAIPARITALEARQAELERRIAELERQALEQVKRSVPWTWPSTQPEYPTPAYPHQPILPGSDDARCPVCNNRYADMTHYVCSHPQCPSRITCSATHGDGTTTAS